MCISAVLFLREKDLSIFFHKSTKAFRHLCFLCHSIQNKPTNLISFSNWKLQRRSFQVTFLQRRSTLCFYETSKTGSVLALIPFTSFQNLLSNEKCVWAVRRRAGRRGALLCWHNTHTRVLTQQAESEKNRGATGTRTDKRKKNVVIMSRWLQLPDRRAKISKSCLNIVYLNSLFAISLIEDSDSLKHMIQLLASSYPLGHLW